MHNEGPQSDRRRESPDKGELRMRAEEDALMQSLATKKEKGEITEEEVNESLELLVKKHNIERTTGMPFASDEAFDEFDRHAGGMEGDFAPDLELPLEQGKIYRFDGKEWVYMGFNKEGERILRREGDESGTSEELPLGGLEARSLFLDTSEGSPRGEDAADDDTTKETPPDAHHHSASAPPPSEIESVSAPAEGGAALEGDTEAAEHNAEIAQKLNLLGEAIQEQHDISNANKDARNTNDDAKKKWSNAERELRRLYKEAKALAIDLVGGEVLAPLVKLADASWVKIKPDEAKARPKEEQDAYFDADRRKRAFYNQLGAKNVNPKIAGSLYKRSLDRAKDLDWLAKELKEGNVEVLNKPQARGALEWHDVLVRRPDQAEAVLGEILPIVEQYRSLPPKEERPKKEVKEKKRPIERLLESLASGQDIDDGVLRSFIKGGRMTADERLNLETELERRKEKRKAEREGGEGEKRPSYSEYVRELVRDGKGETVPWDALEAHAKDPDVAAFMKAHPELAPKDDEKQNEKQSAKKVAKPTLSGKALADVIEAGKPIGVVAEEGWEIKAAARRGRTSAQPPPSTNVDERGKDVAERAPASLSVQSKSLASEKHPESNEDAVIEDKENGIFAVLDGMGGHAAGAVASTSARDAIHKALRGLSPKASLEDTTETIKEALQSASASLLEMGKADASLHGLGTTATILKINEGDNGERIAVVGNVGDSRAYVMHADGTFEQITQDDDIFGNLHEPLTAEEETSFRSKLNNETDRDALSEKERVLFGNRNRITQALGGEYVEPRIASVALRIGDKLLLTSDGIHDNLTQGELKTLLETTEGASDAPLSPVERIVAAAQKRSKEVDADGHPALRAKEDDMTAVLIDFAEEGSSSVVNEQEPGAASNEVLVQGANATEVLPEPPLTVSVGYENMLNEAGGLRSGEIVTWRSSTGTDFPNLKISGFSKDGAYVFTEGSSTGIPIAEVFPAQVTESGVSDEAPQISQDELRVTIEQYEAKADRTPEDESKLAALKAIYRLGEVDIATEALGTGVTPNEPTKTGPTPEAHEKLLAAARERVEEMKKQFGEGSVEVKDAVSDLYALQLTSIAKEEKKVVPVEVGEAARKAFDPERELALIARLPKGERREKLKEYKIKLIWQRKGIARAQAKAIAAIRKNPDMTDEEFMEHFGEEAKKYEASEAQRARAEVIFGKYKQKHEAVEKYYAQYPDPKDLFRAVFGIDAKGSVEIVKGPMTLCFRLKNEDFVNVYGGKRYSDDRAVSSETRKKAGLAGGFALHGSIIPELAGTLLVEKATLTNKIWGDPEAIRAHEEQHAINSLFQEDLRHDRQFEKETGAWELVLDAASPQEVREAFFKLLRARREGMENHGYASDEIFAYLRDGRSPKEIVKILTSNKLYDYFDKERKNIKEDLAGYRGERFTAEEKKMYDSVADEVFGKEYKERVGAGLEAYGDLKSMGFTSEGARGVLLHEPLVRWGKVVERLQTTENVLSESVAKGFEERFGIDQQDLINMEGFTKLSEGQQLLVLRNLEQITLLDVKKEARAIQKEEWGKTSALKKIWKQLYSFGMNPEHRVAELEQELLAKARKGEFATGEGSTKALAERLTDIEALVKVALEGPAVDVKEDGDLALAYVSEKDLFDSAEDPKITPEHRKLLEDFNQVASVFAGLPREWGYDTSELSRRDRRRYLEARDAYERARGGLSRLYRERFAEGGVTDPPGFAMRAMNAVDERVQLDQLFNTHPDAEKALEQIEDQSTILSAAKEFWKAKGAFILYGAAARGATVALLGTMPVVGAVLAYAGSAGVAGVVGKKIGEGEAKRLFKAKRADGRMSEEDLREEIEYGVSTFAERIAEAEAELAKTNLGEKDREEIQLQLATAKERLAKEGEIPKEKQKQKRKIKEYTDAAFFTDRIERLVEKLNNTGDAAGRGLLEQKVAQTVALMHEKFEAGLINFGGSSLEEHDERKGNVIANRLSFIQAMAFGRAFVVVDHDNVEMEFSRMIKLHEAKIDDVRKKEIVKAGKKAAMWRAGFALAGAGIADGVRQIMHFGDFGGASGTPQQGGSGTSVFEQHDADPDAYDPDAFTPQNFDKNIPSIVGRTPSPEELAALRGTGGVDDPLTANMDNHAALIVEMKKSPTPLSHERIAEILGRGAKAPATPPWLAPNEEIVPWDKPGLPKTGEAVQTYTVRAGDNFTNILKANVAELKGLPTSAQENAVQNLLKRLSPEELKEVGLDGDPNKLAVGQTIDLNRVAQFLHGKKVGGITIIERAGQLAGGAASEAPKPGVVGGAEFGKFIVTPEGKQWLGTPEGKAWDEVSRAFAENKNLSQDEITAILQKHGLPPDWGNFKISPEVAPQVTPEAAGADEIERLIREYEAKGAAPEGRALWGQLSESSKQEYVVEAIPRQMHEDMGKLFIRGPFEEWPKEWLSVRGRDAVELLSQTEKTVYRPLPRSTEEVASGYQWSIAEKIQKYINEHGLTREKGFIPHEKETVEEFVKRALGERVLREGPLPWVK